MSTVSRFFSSGLLKGGLLILLLLGTIALRPARSQTFTRHTVTSRAEAAQSVSGGDFDGDGDIDVLTVSFFSDELLWYENRGGTFKRHLVTRQVDGPYDVTVGDLNGDQHVDILSASVKDSTVAWYENGGNARFSSQKIIASNVGFPQDVHVGRVNGDRAPDVLVAAHASGKILWAENKRRSTNRFGPVRTISSSAKGARSVFAADLDDDGVSEILSASDKNDEVSWYDSTGTGLEERVLANDVGGASDVHAADVTGDGTIDVLATAVDSDEVALYEAAGEADGEVAFAERIVGESETEARGVYPADIDGDGATDLLTAATGNNTVAWYENLGGAHFRRRVVSDTTGQPTSVFAADVDGDGDTDVLASAQESDAVYWFETNLPPIARDTSFEVKEDKVLHVAAPGPLGNDRDPDADSLAARKQTGPSSGSVSNFEGDGGFTFSAVEGFDGLGKGETRSVSFRYEARDRSGLVDTARVAIRVIGVNDCPIARRDQDTTVAGEAVATRVLANDGDVDGRLVPSSVGLTALPDHGSVRAMGSGKIRYRPDEKFAGTDRYAYTVVDENGGVDTARVTVRVRPSAPKAVRGKGGDQTAVLRWRPPSEVGIRGYRIYRQHPSDTLRGDPLAVIRGSSTTQYEVTELTNRRVYDFLVTAVGPGGIESHADTARVVPRPSTVVLDGSVSFGAFDRSTGYRMVGMPGRTDGIRLSATVEGIPGEDWTAFAAQGIGAAKEMVQFRDDSTRFGFGTGRGFWLLGRKAWTPKRTVNAIPLEHGAVARIGLSEGWSVITNPFPEPLSWARVQAATPDFTASLWGFDGEFSPRSSMEPYEGYYVFNDPTQPVDTLRFPYPVPDGSMVGDGRSGAAGHVVRDRGADARRGGAAGLTLIAQAVRSTRRGRVATATVQLRVAEWATAGRDSADQFAPPAVGRRSRLRVRSETVSETYPWLRRDVRSLGADRTATFDVRLCSPASQSVRLSARDFRGLSRQAAYLYRPSTGHVVDLRREDVRVQGGRECPGHQFEVWIGSPKRLRERAEERRPEKLMLRPVAPNPVKDDARLRYSVPESKAPAEIEIRIYDVLGREVQRLVEAEKGAGWHVVRWTGKDNRGNLASGMYFFRFIADGTPVVTRKVSLVR